MQCYECQKCVFMNAYEKNLVGDADSDATNFSTGYDVAETDFFQNYVILLFLLSTCLPGNQYRIP